MGGLARRQALSVGVTFPSEEDSLSSESIVSPAPPATAPVPTAVESCASCGAALAPDQRYCLECGARRPALGSVLAGDLRSLIALSSGEPATPARVERSPEPAAVEPARAGATSAVIAGVGVLLLAMGVGVLIGRSGSGGKTVTPPAQVVSVAAPAATSSGAGAAASTPASGTTSGAKHSSSKHKSSKSSSAGSSTAEPAGGVGQTPSKPAPPSAAESLKGAKGGSYEQKSKNLPNVISTG